MNPFICSTRDIGSITQQGLGAMAAAGADKGILRPQSREKEVPALILCSNMAKAEKATTSRNPGTDSANRHDRMNACYRLGWPHSLSGFLSLQRLYGHRLARAQPANVF